MSDRGQPKLSASASRVGFNAHTAWPTRRGAFRSQGRSRPQSGFRHRPRPRPLDGDERQPGISGWTRARFRGPAQGRRPRAMTAARRGQRRLPPTCDVYHRETSPVRPPGRASATPRPSSPAPISAPPACHLTWASTSSARMTGHEAIHTPSSGTSSGLHPRSTSFTAVALVRSGSANLSMTSL
jgi:hypothetical protein